MIFLVFSFLLLIVLPIWNFLEKPFLHMEQISQIDRELSDRAEEICLLTNSIQKIESNLALLRKECLVTGGNPGAIANLVIQSETFLTTERILFTQILQKITLLKKDGPTIYRPPIRSAPTACGVAGPLIWPEPPKNFLSHRKNLGGFDIFLPFATQKVAWSFASEEVKTL